ncbi:hypothetical protein AALP_AA3G244400 [Arabis alpina]|uniref:Uncharacterized protein n=1 Tax=Arabis alpina TaxID=50452 RepID=A0A087HBD3_ARAAL|nr:hypothetical protein AALP_AA3G244400 [Arabis alpina]
MKSIIDSLRNLVQPEQPLVPSSPTDTHSSDAIQATGSSPVVVAPSVDHLEPGSSQFQTPLERTPAPISAPTSIDLVLLTRPLLVPPPGSDESTSTDSIPGSPSAFAGGVSETTQSASPLLIKNYVGAARRAVSPHTSPIEVSDGDEGVPVPKKRRVMPRGGSGPASRVRSARSQSMGPHAIVDSTRFHTFVAQTRYDRFKSQNLLCEDVFMLKELPVGVHKFIFRAGFQRTLTDVKPFDDDVVREFWAHLPSVKSEDVSVRVWLHGHEYEFSSAKRPVDSLPLGVPSHSSAEPVFGPTDKPDHATVSGPSSLMLHRAIRHAIQILQAALTGGDEIEQDEESRAKAKGKRKAA